MCLRNRILSCANACSLNLMRFKIMITVDAFLWKWMLGFDTGFFVGKGKHYQECQMIVFEAYTPTLIPMLFLPWE